MNAIETKKKGKRHLDEDIQRRREFRKKYCQDMEAPIRIVIDEWWNIPLWKGKNSDGKHQCPKGPKDASNWAYISHRPPIGKERWRIVPFGELWAIRYEPLEWECQWRIEEVHIRLEDAKEALKKY